jgi:hypothetical protein
MAGPGLLRGGRVLSALGVALLAGQLVPHDPPPVPDLPRQEHRFIWALDVSSIPAYLPRVATVHAVVAATETVTEGAGLAPAVLGGYSDRSADVTPEGQCVPDTNSDGISTVSFGPLPEGSVAVSCSYVDRGDIWQADVMLSDEPGLFTTSPAEPGCTDAYDVQAVVTHERGHSFGLGDVPESPTTDALTMSGFVGRCDASARTLTHSDLLALRLLYTPRP